MRLRNKPWAEPFLEENDDLVLRFDEELKDEFENIFGNNNFCNLSYLLHKPKQHTVSNSEHIFNSVLSGPFIFHDLGCLSWDC